MSTDVQQPAMRTTVVMPVAEKTRLLSLDVFRGLTIAAMILVNDAGDWDHVYRPLEHAEWHGWTPTDLIFPFFLFIVGVSMVLSSNARRARGATRGQLLSHAVKRGAIIVAIGLALNAYHNFDPHTMRFAGVLQRIGIVYMITAFIVEYCGPKFRAFIAAALLVGYWLALRYYPVPGYGPGILTTDGNLAGYIDRALMYNHLYIVHRFDPEGVLSTFPAIGTCLLGVFTGEWIRDKSGEPLIRTLLIGAVFGLGLGKVWNMWFPINKNLWSSSFVLFTAGFAMAMLALCYWLIDVRGWKKWAEPFRWYGVNPLGIYFLAGFLATTTINVHIGGKTLKDVVYSGIYAHLTASPYFNSMLYGLTYVLLFLVVAWALYRKKIFIRV